MKPLFAIILAAGKGTRMKSKKHKVLHAVCGKPMIDHTLDQLFRIQPRQILLVTGYEGQAVREHIGERVSYVEQTEQLGTAHAVMQTASVLRNEKGMTLVLNGDHPLYTSETITKLIQKHEASGAAATVLSAEVDDPTGYGRVVCSSEGDVEYIVEHKDASIEERSITQINTGTYLFDNEKLFHALTRVTNDNAQGEYYLPDVISILKTSGEIVRVQKMPDAREAAGINDRVQLAEAESYMRERILRQHMMAGVTIIDPSHTYIDADVIVGADTIIEPGVTLRGSTIIGEGCHIGPRVEMMDTTVEDEVRIRDAVVQSSRIGMGSNIGPYVYIRPKTMIGDHVKIGCFIDLKNTSVGSHSTLSHLAYVGDAEIGDRVNIGCGAVTVNYDGRNKHRTVVGEGSFIGCNANLIAPVTIGKGSYVATGSTITEDIPEDSFAIARERQTTKVDYVPGLLDRLSKGE